MKRSVRPFLVEVKRTKRSASSASGPALMFPEEQVASSHGPTTPEQELIARIFSGSGARETPRTSSGERVDESAARAPRILESLASTDNVVVAPEPEIESTGADEEEGQFGWLVYRREHGGGRAPRRPRTPAPAAADTTERPGVVVKARRGRPPRSAASAPRVLDPAIWSEGLAAAPARQDETAPSREPVVEATPVASDPQPRVRRARAARPAVTVDDAAERPVARAAARAKETGAAPAAAVAAKESDGRRAVAGRRRGAASAELPAGQRWKKRLPKVLW